MDTFDPFQTFEYNEITFQASRFEEYENAKLTKSGQTNVTIFSNREDDTYRFYLINNNISDRIDSEFEFDLCFSLADRFHLCIVPSVSNVHDMAIESVKQMYAPTRDTKNYNTNEPIVGNFFTQNMNLVKVAFKLTNPERLIEFYP